MLFKLLTGLSAIHSRKVMNCQARKFSGEMMSQGRQMGKYRRSNVALVSWAGFPSTCLRVKFHSAKPFKHKTQHWYECWHLDSFCWLNGSWEAADKKAFGFLEYEQWDDFYVKSEEISQMACRFNICKISSSEILDSGFFFTLKRNSSNHLLFLLQES